MKNVHKMGIQNRGYTRVLPLFCVILNQNYVKGFCISTFVVYTKGFSIQFNFRF